MSAPRRPPDRGGGLLTVLLFGLTLGLLGLLGGLPDYLGPVVAGVAVVASTVARRRWPGREEVGPLVPALAALVALTATAPVGAATDLFAGLSGLAFLLWVADDPSRPVGGGRRAVPTIGPVALAVGAVWGIGLLLNGRSEAVGLAGALIAAGLVVLGVLVVSVSRRPPEPPAVPPRRLTPSPARARRGVARDEPPLPWELES